MAIIPVGRTGADGPLDRAAGGAEPGIRITWAAELADRLADGLPLTVLGQIALEAPLGRLLVIGRSEGGASGAAALAAVLMPDAHPGALALAPFGIGPLAGAFEPPEALLARFPSRRTSDAIYVQDEQGADRFVAGPGVVLNHLIISCGTWPLLVPLFGPRTRPRPVADRQALEADLTAFCAVVAAAVNALYAKRRTPLPVAHLMLRPTGLNADAALGGLRWLGKSAADLVARLPKAAPAFPPDLSRGAPRLDVTAHAGGASFDDVGGQAEAKRELQAVCTAIRNPEAYRRWGARPPKGVLLYGPPGTGKTLLARCVAAESGAKFFHLRAADITSKWYGEAEQRLQAAFDRARREAPAVLFFDEIDAIARVREESHEATHRVVSTLLENMDGLEESRGVVVLAATNRPEAVDPALLRPGRFDRLVEVPLPDRAGRRGVFAVHIDRAERNAGRTVIEPLDAGAWEALLDASEGFSGAEVEEVVRRALEAKVRSGATEGELSVAELIAEARALARRW